MEVSFIWKIHSISSPSPAWNFSFLHTLIYCPFFSIWFGIQKGLRLTSNLGFISRETIFLGVWTQSWAPSFLAKDAKPLYPPTYMQLFNWTIKYSFTHEFSWIGGFSEKSRRPTWSKQKTTAIWWIVVDL